jgi:hypothetical protein
VDALPGTDRLEIPFNGGDERRVGNRGHQLDNLSLTTPGYGEDNQVGVVTRVAHLYERQTWDGTTAISQILP